MMCNVRKFRSLVVENMKLMQHDDTTNFFFLQRTTLVYFVVFLLLSLAYHTPREDVEAGENFWRKNQQH